MNNKGFINILAIAIMGIAVILSGVFYADYLKKEAKEAILGSVASTTQLTDTINTLRTNVNTINENTFASSTWLKTANNLSDSTTSTVRANLGLTDTAQTASSTWLKTANNLSDSTTSTVRANLGLNDAALTASSTYLKVANNGSDINSTSTFRTNLDIMKYVAPGASGHVLTSNGTTWTSASSSAGLDISYITSLSSTTLAFSDDTEKTTSVEGTYTKIKEIKTINDLAAVKVMVDLKGSRVEVASSLARLYKNGVAIGDIHGCTNGSCQTYATFADNATSSLGDLFQIYASQEAGYSGTAYVKNFRLYYDLMLQINHVSQDP